MRKDAAGFTLIELIIAVAVVAILASIAYPSYVSQMAKARRQECRVGVIQAMQQQERYFAQKNTYITVASDDAAPAVKVFSADSAQSSACRLDSVPCSDESSRSPRSEAQCIEVRATPQKADPAAISYLYLNSDGQRGCAIGGARTVAEPSCWQ